MALSPNLKTAILVGQVLQKLSELQAYLHLDQDQEFSPFWVFCFPLVVCGVFFFASSIPGRPLLTSRFTETMYLKQILQEKKKKIQQATLEFVTLRINLNQLFCGREWYVGSVRSDQPAPLEC